LRFLANRKTDTDRQTDTDRETQGHTRTDRQTDATKILPALHSIASVQVNLTGLYERQNLVNIKRSINMEHLAMSM